MTFEAVQIPVPDGLSIELTKMRRNAEDFHVSGMATCQFCGGRVKTAYQVKTAESEFVVGSWCPAHGWLYFDSVGHPPTERLTASEVEDRKLEQQRKAKAATTTKGREG